MSLRPPVHLIAALEAGGGIGAGGAIPWRLPKEYRHFQRLTSETRDPAKRNAVILGRACWDSVPARFRPLKGRLNLVLSRSITEADMGDFPGVLLAASYDEALDKLAEPQYNVETIWNCGGVEVYRVGLESAARLYLTHISQSFDCDRFFPEFSERVFRPVSVDGVSGEEQKEGDVSYRFAVYERVCIE